MEDSGQIEASGFCPVNIQTLTQSLTEVMAERIGAPIGLTTVIDEANERQVFIAAVGLPEPYATLRETALSRSFCKIVKATNAPLIVTNSRTDDRVRTNPIIDELGVMAYLGYPLRSRSGEPLGSVCVLDRHPREWTVDEQAHVSALAETISMQMNLQASLLTSEEERRQIEAANAALELRNRQFADVAQNMPGAIFQYAENPDGTVEIEFMSPGCVNVWELTPAEIGTDATPMWDMILPEDLPGMLATVSRSGQTQSFWHHRWRIKAPSGKIKWLEGRGQPRRGKDGRVIWNSLILDVTQTVLAEQKSAETMRLLFEAGKQETIARIAGGIAHDFNNLLMVVRTNAELLMDPSLKLDRAALGRSIIKAAELGGELTKRLVNFARQSDMHPSRVNVNGEITEMRDVLRSALPARIGLVVTLAEDLPTVFVDRSFLESALLNLVLNARDATPGDGVIRIETARVQVTADLIRDCGESIAPGPYAMVSVTDSGEGMTPEVMARVFEPFFTTKAPTKGTGLGLAMVDGLVRQSGGMIRVESELGVGTTFRLYFPVSDAGHAAGHDAGITVTAGQELSGPVTVLLVEDQDEVRAALQRILASDGHKVIDAASGDAGLALFRSDPGSIDIVVSDVVMPGQLQGPDMVRQIRKLVARMPVVYVSGYPHEVTFHHGTLHQGDMTLIKPVSPDVLRTAITRALRATNAPR